MEILLKSLKWQLKMSDKEVGKLIKGVDQNGDGKVEVKEFFYLIEFGKKGEVIHKEFMKRSGIRQSFQKYDADGNGGITRDEFRKIVKADFQKKT
jgi:Ca2+-binding EF-hand superfamily protein